MAQNPNRKLVLLVSPAAQLGGAEKALLDLIGSPKDATRFSVLLFAEGPLQVELQRRKIPTTVVALPRPLATLGDWSVNRNPLRLFLLMGRMLLTIPSVGLLLWRLRKTIQTLNPHLIHSNGAKAHILTALASPSHIPAIWHLRDFGSNRQLTKLLFSQLSSRTKLMLTNSQAVKSDYAHFLPSKKLRCLHDAVDTVHYCPGPPDPQIKLLFGNSSSLKIGLIATYAKWKGQKLFLKAIQQLPSTHQLNFFIIGGPVYQTHGSQFSKTELQSYATELGIEKQITFIPFQRDIRSVYRSLDIVVHASTNPEPFGLTIAEAMACAKPVIVSQSGGACEIFEHGVSAHGFRTADASDLSQSIQQLVEDENYRASLSVNARPRILSQFSQQRLAEELEEIYQEVA